MAVLPGIVGVERRDVGALGSLRRCWFGIVGSGQYIRGRFLRCECVLGSTLRRFVVVYPAVIVIRHW